MKTITEDGEIVDVVTHEPVAMAQPFWKTPYNHNTDAEAAATALSCKDPSKTQQQFAKDADINAILAKFLQTGELNTTGIPTYINYEGEFDLQDSIVTSSQVEAAWAELPTAVRAILRTPKQFVEYIDHCMQTGDLDPLRELGLAKPLDPQPTTPTGGTPAPVPSEKAPEGLKTAPKEPKTEA